MLIKTYPPCSDSPWFVAVDGFALGGGNTPSEALNNLLTRKRDLLNMKRRSGNNE